MPGTKHQPFVVIHKHLSLMATAHMLWPNKGIAVPRLNIMPCPARTGLWLGSYPKSPSSLPLNGAKQAASQRAFSR